MTGEVIPTGARHARMQQAAVEQAGVPIDLQAERQRLLALWRVGDFAEVWRRLPPLVTLAPCDPLVQALNVIRAYDQRDYQYKKEFSIAGYCIMMDEIVNLGRFDVARANLPLLETMLGKSQTFSTLRIALRACPDARGLPFAGLGQVDVLTVPAPGSRTVLFAFCGNGHGFAVPLALIHGWFARLGFHVVYLKDVRRLFYLHGITSLGPGHAAAVVGLRRIAAELGATRIACIGHSAGGFAALRFALDLGAQAVLSLGGPTTLFGAMDEIRADEVRLGLEGQAVAATAFDVATAYKAATVTPRAWLVYAEDNDNDRRQAGALAGLPGIDLIAVPEFAYHNVLGRLIESSRWEELLTGLAAAVLP